MDQLIYATGKTISENSDRINDSEKKEIEDAVLKAKESLESENVDDLKNASDELTKVSHSLAEQMYKQASEEEASKNADPSSDDKKEAKKNEGDVIDAEFTEKKL